nr:MAG TPA: hypothetical protein [Caudoviricetes sp.]
MCESSTTAVVLCSRILLLGTTFELKCLRLYSATLIDT